MSEYVPGTEPKAGFFPLRNRIISGCADLVLVIEARKKSGTLITVDAALEQGREVYALPGRVTDTLAQGCNELIRQGAGIAVSPESVSDAVWEIWQYKWQSPVGRVYNKEEIDTSGENGVGKENGTLQEKKMRAVLSGEEWQLYQLLSEQGKTPEELYQLLHETDASWNIAIISALLIQLCVRNCAYTENGRFYRKNAQNDR